MYKHTMLSLNQFIEKTLEELINQILKPRISLFICAFISVCRISEN